MKGRERATCVAMVAVLALALVGCSDTPDYGTGTNANDEQSGIASTVTSDPRVEDFGSLDLPIAPSDSKLDGMLSSKDGVPIAKVGGQWVWRYASETRGSDGYVMSDMIVVNMKVNGIIIQRALYCGLPVAIMSDVQSDDEAYMTYGDNSTYAYVIHIPAE